MLIKSTLMLGVVSISFYAINTEIKADDNESLPINRNLSNLGLNEIPSEVFQNEKLRVLDLSHNDINNLDSKIMDNKTLYELNLSYNPRLNIEQVVDYLPDSALEYLNLEACHLPILPVGMERFSKLRHLDLSHNHLVTVPYDLAELMHLEVLDLSHNHLEDLEQSAYGWYNLRELDVRDNSTLRHRDLIRALSLLEKLQIVRMSDVSEVGEAFQQLKTKRLEIYDSPKLKLNGHLAANQEIQELYLNHALSRRPGAVLKEVNNCLNLRSLKIRENWTKVPGYIKEINTITELDLSGNQLHDVTALKQLKALKKLNLTNNPVSEHSLADLRAALPNCVVKFETASTVEPLKIEKPISHAELKKETNTVDPSQAQEVSFSTAKLDVPANAFLDANGELVTESVKLEYTEYMNPAQIMLSGIPMSYDSAGVRYNFSSAGMFELNAKTESGKEVFPNPNQPITVNMNSSSTDTDYNLYAYDNSYDRWKLLGKDEVTGITERQKKGESKGRLEFQDAEYDTTIVYSGDYYAMRRYLRKMDVFKTRLRQNRLKYPKVRAKVKPNRKTNSFTIDIQELAKIKTKDLLVSNHRIKLFENENWVYEGSHAEKLYAYLNKIDSYSMKVYKAYRESGRYSLNGPSFIKNINLEPSEDGNTFVLSFNYKDTLIKLNVYPEKMDYSSTRQVKKNTSILKKYNQKSRKDFQRESTAKREIKRRNRKLLREMKESGLDETIESLIAFDIKEYRKKMVAEGLLSPEYLITRSLPIKASRSFRLPGFGVFNCDRIQRMKYPEPVLAKFVDDKGRVLRPEKTYVLVFNTNSVLSYSKKEFIRVDKGTDYNIILVLNNEEIALVNSGSVSGRKLSRASATIPTRIIRTKDMSTEDLVIKMMS